MVLVDRMVVLTEKEKAVLDSSPGQGSRSCSPAGRRSIVGAFPSGEVSTVAGSPKKKSQMMPRFEFSFRLVLLGAAVFRSLSLAQPPTDALDVRGGSTEVTVFAGISLVNNSEKERAGLRIETKAPLGGRVAYNFDKHSAVEFSVGNPLFLSVNYLHHFYPLGGRLVPYLTAGGGGSRYGLELQEGPIITMNEKPTLNEDGPGRSQTAFAGNFGAGIKYFLGDSLAVRFDVRDVVGRYSATFASAPGTIKVARTLNDFQITVGFVFRLGGR
jgi:hypothetical protein